MTGQRSNVVLRGFFLATTLLFPTGCDTLLKRDDADQLPKVPAPQLPGKANPQRVSQFVFYSDTPIRPNAPLFAELSTLRDRIFDELHLPPSDSIIQVYLFDDQDKYERYMRYRYPDLPKRRAFFVAVPRSAGGPRELLVYTYWGDNLRQDLRHELTHALLNSVVRDVPLWLDEALAELYELPPEKNGVNSAHIEAILHGDVTPNLAALERLDRVEQMGRPQYQEAWAWAHLMLRSTPENRAVLFAYLQQLRDPSATPGTLRSRLAAVLPEPEQALRKHLASLDPPAATIRPAANR